MQKPSKYAGLEWCREGELNPQGAKHRRILSPLRLPVPPSRRNWNSSNCSILLLLALWLLFFGRQIGTYLCLMLPVKCNCSVVQISFVHGKKVDAAEMVPVRWLMTTSGIWSGWTPASLTASSGRMYSLDGKSQERVTVIAAVK